MKKKQKKEKKATKSFIGGFKMSLLKQICKIKVLKVKGKKSEKVNYVDAIYLKGFTTNELWEMCSRFYKYSNPKSFMRISHT